MTDIDFEGETVKRGAFVKPILRALLVFPLLVLAAAAMMFALFRVKSLAFNDPVERRDLADEFLVFAQAKTNGRSCTRSVVPAPWRPRCRRLGRICVTVPIPGNSCQRAICSPTPGWFRWSAP